MVLVSMVAVCASLLLASFFGVQYGVGTTDVISVLLTPFQTLNAEFLPAWFDKKPRLPKMKKSGTHPFLNQGFSGNLMLLLWAVMGSFIVMAFLSNIRAMLLKPVYEKPIDSTKIILDVGKVPLIPAGGLWENHFKASENVWERLAAKDGTFFDQRDRDLTEKYFKEDVHTSGTHVMMVSVSEVAYKVQNEEYFKKLSSPVFHVSKERLR